VGLERVLAVSRLREDETKVVGVLTIVVQTLGMSTMPAMWPWIGAHDKRR